MTKAFAVLCLLALAGCASVPAPQTYPPSACDAGESSYACQVERYQNVSQ